MPECTAEMNANFLNSLDILIWHSVKLHVQSMVKQYTLRVVLNFLFFFLNVVADNLTTFTNNNGAIFRIYILSFRQRGSHLI